MGDDRATDIVRAYQVCDLEKPEIDQLHWRVDLAEARGAKTNLSGILRMAEPGRHVHIAFTGHRGCGKSTELLYLMEQWRETFFVIYFPVTDLLDPNDITYSDLYFTTAMVVAREFHHAGMPLDPTVLGEIEGFVSQVVTEATESKETWADLGAEVELGGEIPFFAKLKALFTSHLKAATQHKTSIRKIIERDITRLMTDTGRLLDDARSKLAGRADGRTDLLIIFDNLDRLPPEPADTLVFWHGEFLRGLRAHAVYTLPVSLLYSRAGLSSAFPHVEILPMVRTVEYRDDRVELPWDEDGVTALCGAVEKRVCVDDVFAAPELLRDLARYSGGCLRHLMQLIRGACLRANTRGATKLDREDIDGAMKELQFAFERLLTEEQYEALARIARTRSAENDEPTRQVLASVAALEYNGEQRWNYVHPLVRRIRRFQEALKNGGAPA